MISLSPSSNINGRAGGMNGGNSAIGAAILKRSRCPSEVSTSLPSSIRRKNPVGDDKTSYFPQAEAPHQGGTTPAGSR
jgi:hypothetical protein